MMVDLIQGIMPSNANPEEKRWRDMLDEGCFSYFGLVLQSLMSLQAPNAEETRNVQGDEISLSGDISSNALLKATEAALKVPLYMTSMTRAQSPGDAGLHQSDGALPEGISQDGQAVFLSKQVHPVHQRALSGQVSSQQLYPVEEVGGDEVRAQLDQNVSGILHSADVTQEPEALYDKQWYGLYGASDSHVKQAMKEFTVVDTSNYNQQLHVSEKMVDIKGGITSEKDGTEKSNRLNSFEGMSWQQGDSPVNLKAVDEHANVEPIALRVGSMHEDVRDRDDEFFKFKHGKEGLPWERLYTNEQLQQTFDGFNGEVNAVYDERSADFHAMLADVADKVKVLLTNKRSEMEVLLKPPELGRMVLKVAMEDGALAVRITVESNAVKDFLQSHAQELKAMLAQKGYSFTNVDVNIGQGYQQPHHDGTAGVWQLEIPMPRRVRSGVADMQPNVVRTATYYEGHHRFDCLV